MYPINTSNSYFPKAVLPTDCCPLLAVVETEHQFVRVMFSACQKNIMNFLIEVLLLKDNGNRCLNQRDLSKETGLSFTKVIMVLVELALYLYVCCMVWYGIYLGNYDNNSQCTLHVLC
jgi:type IV secretory pathway VirB3-like protein